VMEAKVRREGNFYEEKRRREQGRGGGKRGRKERHREMDNSWEIGKKSAETKGRGKQANEEELKSSRGGSWKDSRSQKEKS
jgi:hypothetical protein